MTTGALNASGLLSSLLKVKTIKTPSLPTTLTPTSVRFLATPRASICVNVQNRACRSSTKSTRRTRSEAKVVERTVFLSFFDSDWDLDAEAKTSKPRTRTTKKTAKKLKAIVKSDTKATAEALFAAMAPTEKETKKKVKVASQARAGQKTVTNLSPAVQPQAGKLQKISAPKLKLPAILIKKAMATKKVADHSAKRMLGHGRIKPLVFGQLSLPLTLPATPEVISTVKSSAGRVPSGIPRGCKTKGRASRAVSAVRVHKALLSSALPRILAAAKPTHTGVRYTTGVTTTYKTVRPRETSTVHTTRSNRSSGNTRVQLHRRQNAAKINSRDIFAVQKTPVQANTQTIAVEKTRNGVTVRAHFISHEGKFIFAGSEQVRPTNTQNRIGTPHALWAPGLMSEERPLIRNFGTPGGGVPGGETALEERIPEEEAVVEETFVALLLEQLKMGPQSLESNQLWESFNSYLFTTRFAPITGFITREEWNSQLKTAMQLAVRYTPVIDENGMRSLTGIHQDAAKILGIDTDTFAQWEDHLDQESIARHLAPEGARPSGQLSSVLDKRIGIIASETFPVGNRETAIGMDQETDLQWAVARIAMIQSREKKLSTAQSLINSLNEQNMHAAARFLALLVRHSEINELGVREDTLLAPWSKEDLNMLTSRLMNSQTWGIVSHRSFRQHLTPLENKQINRFVYSANYDSAVEKLNEVDVFEISDEEFWRLVDATGHGETLMEDALVRMVQSYR
jgi:hypothetical protein